jgi:hypothetical protein
MVKYKHYLLLIRFSEEKGFGEKIIFYQLCGNKSYKKAKIEL